MPTVSPGRRAGGLTRLEDIEEEAELAGIRPILNEKLAPAEQLRRSGEINIALPAHNLDSTLGFNLERRLAFACGDGSYSRGAGTGAGRARLAHSALKEADLHMVFFISDY